MLFSMSEVGLTAAAAVVVVVILGVTSLGDQALIEPAIAYSTV